MTAFLVCVEQIDSKKCNRRAITILTMRPNQCQNVDNRIQSMALIGTPAGVYSVTETIPYVCQWLCPIKAPASSSTISTFHKCHLLSLRNHGSLCASPQNLNYLIGGLVYLPSGVGGLLAAYSIGKLLDRDYASIARKVGLPVDKKSINAGNLAEYPIEMARLRSTFVLIAIRYVNSVSFRT